MDQHHHQPPSSSSSSVPVLSSSSDLGPSDLNIHLAGTGGMDLTEILFLDNVEGGGGQAIFRGIGGFDCTGALVVDNIQQFSTILGGGGSAELINFISHDCSSSSSLPQGTGATTTTSPSTSTSTSIALATNTHPLTPLNQNQKLNDPSLVTFTKDIHRTTEGDTSNLQPPSSIIPVGTSSKWPTSTSVELPCQETSKLLTPSKINSSSVTSSSDFVKHASLLEIENQKPVSESGSSPAGGESRPLAKPPFQCEHCSKTYMSWASFKRHKSEHLDDKAYRCPLCSMAFNHEVNLTLHEMIHNAELSGCLECTLCPVKFTRLASLKSHIRTHESEENMVCCECGDEFGTKARLEQHMGEHKTPKSLVHRCKLCSACFTHPALLRDHAKEHQAVKTQLKMLSVRKKRPPPKSAREMKAAAPETSKSKDKESKKKFICTVCSKRFDKNSQLVRHFRIHSGDRPYSCTHCDRNFNQKSTLASHVQSVHEKRKPFACHICQCQFSQRGNLRSHLLKVHVQSGNGEQSFRCQDCPCVFRKLASLNSHIAKLHTKTKKRNVTVSNMDNSFDTGTTTLIMNEAGELIPSISDADNGIVVLDVIQGSDNAAGVQSQQFVLNTAFMDGMVTMSSAKEIISEVQLIHEVSGKQTSHTIKVKRIGNVKLHLCPYDCTKSFTKASDMLRHIRTHTKEKPFVCDVCDKGFSVKSTLTTHKKTHSQQKDWECTECHKRFSVVSSLQAHQRLHNGSKPFPCMSCGKSFRTKSQRKIHWKTHAREREGLGLSGKRRLLIIGGADKVDASKVRLPDPLRITSEGLVPVPNRCQPSHNNIERLRPYRCNQCPSAFTKSSHLKQHTRSHNGERPYQCFQCYRSFLSSGVLKSHIKTHEGVRAYRCGVCQLTFTTKGSLTRHMAIHKEDRSFVCPHCHKTFKSNVSCRKHIRTHIAEFIAAGEHLEVLHDDTLVQQEQDHLGYDNGHPSDISSRNTNGDDLSASNAIDNSILVEADVTTPTLIEQSTDDTHIGEEEMRSAAGMDPHTQELHSLSQHQHFSGSILLANQEYSGGLYSLQTMDNIELPISIHSGTTSQPNALFTQTQPYVTANTTSSSYSILQGSSSISNNLDGTGFLSMKNEHEHFEKMPDIVDPSTIPPAVENISIESTDHEQHSNEAANKHSNISDLIGFNFSDIERGKVNICTECGRGFVKKSDLIRHLRIHSGEKPFRCALCDKAFRVKSTKDMHMKTHEGTKRVTCPVCNNMFSTKSSLRVHIRLHTGARPYKCPHCDRAFRTSGHRKAHLSSHFKIPKVVRLEEKPHVVTDVLDTAIVLPPVDTIKGKVDDGSHSVSIPQQFQDNQTIYTTIADPNVTSTGFTDPVQIIGGLQLSLDGTASLSNLQLTGIDVSNLQISDELLQSLGSVIFVSSGSQLLTDLSGASLLGSSTGVSSDTETLSILRADEVHTQKDGDEGTKSSTSTATPTSYSHLQLPTVISVSDLESYIPSEGSLITLNSLMPSDPGPLIASTTATTTTSTIVSVSSEDEGTGPTTTTSSSSNKLCGICGKCFSKPSLLTRHYNSVHIRERPFKCDECGCSFSQKNSLETHKYTHTSERPFSCTLCPFKTVLKAALKRHVGRGHPEADFEKMLTSPACTTSSTTTSRQNVA